MTAEQNKARALELIDRVTNGHDVASLEEFTSSAAILESGRGLVRAFPDLRARVQWVVAESDMVVVFHEVQGTHQGPWLFVEQPSGRPVHTSFMLAFKFDEAGQIVDQWLGSNFVEMLAQLGWGFAPIGELAALPTLTNTRTAPAIANNIERLLLNGSGDVPARERRPSCKAGWRPID